MAKKQRKGLIGALDKRFDFMDYVEKEVFDHPVPPRLNFMYCFGGITFFLFFLLSVTGILMAAYYVPHTEAAFASVEYLQYEVTLGSLIRGIHHWSANLMILFITLHMIRVVITGSYKNPMEFHWISGVVLFLLTLGFGFTGYLLPWNMRAYWASKVGIGMANTVPKVGEISAYLVQGGEPLGALTLSRFFATHVIYLPILTLCFLGIHFLMIRKTGVVEPL
jgi:menaquinol-cytochrome c reductase cytochrome b subunit